MNPPRSSEIARRRLYGRRATYEQFAREALRLRQGDLDKGIRPMTLAEIGAKIGYKDRKTVSMLLAMAEREGYGRDAPKPFKADAAGTVMSNDAFRAHPAIQVWIGDLERRGGDGGALATARPLIAALRTFVQTLKIDPAQLISGSDPKDVLDSARRYIEAFVDLYFEGRSTVRGKGPRPGTTRRHVAYNYAKPVRSFLRAHGYQFPTGDKSVASQAIDHVHGLYSDVRMTLAQYMDAQKYLVERHGIDSDVVRWFAIGVESMARSESLHKALGEWSVHTRPDGREIYVMEMRESKTKRIRGGKFVKYIWSKVAQESLATRKGKHVIANRSLASVRKTLYPLLREMYRDMGLARTALRIPDDPESSYFLLHTGHTQRHIGAQLALAMSDFNYGYVFPQGWTAVAELQKSYGLPPPEFALKTLDGVRLP